MKFLYTVLFLGVFGWVGCRVAPESNSALLDDLLSGTGTKLPIDVARATTAGEYFFNFSGVSFVSPMTEAQYWGPQQDALKYAGKEGAASVFKAAGTQADLNGWFRLLPQATAAGLTKKYRINAKLTFKILQHAGTEGHARLAVACLSRLPTPELPIPGFSSGTTYLLNGGPEQWNDKVLQVVSEPLDLRQCKTDVFLSLGIYKAKAVKMQDPEVQLLSVTGG
jgi:hypothetical protein